MDIRMIRPLYRIIIPYDHGMRLGTNETELTNITHHVNHIIRHFSSCFHSKVSNQPGKPDKNPVDFHHLVVNYPRIVSGLVHPSYVCGHGPHKNPINKTRVN